MGIYLLNLKESYNQPHEAQKTSARPPPHTQKKETFKETRAHVHKVVCIWNLAFEVQVINIQVHFLRAKMSRAGSS